MWEEEKPRACWVQGPSVAPYCSGDVTTALVCLRAAAGEPALPFPRRGVDRRNAPLRLRLCCDLASRRPPRSREQSKRADNRKDTSRTARAVLRFARHSCAPGPWVRDTGQAGGERLRRSLGHS